MNRNYLTGRAIDAAVITMLLLGSGDVRVFATLVAAAMAVVALLATISMTKEAAQIVHGTRLHRLAAWPIKFMYVAALVMSGSLVVALLYLCAAVLLRFQAETIVNKESAQA